MSDKLTVLIPTLNRPDFLYRTLRFYSDMKCKYRFIVGDASTGTMAIENKNLCTAFGCGYVNMPNTSIAVTVKELNKLIFTPYVVILPDDDLLMPDGVYEIIKFLDSNKEYESANGKAAEFMLKENGAYGNIRDLGDYYQRGIYEAKAQERFESFFASYFVLLFAIYRTATWKKMWEHAGQSTEVGFNAEVIPCCLSAILGRTKHLESLYLLRQEHNRRVLGKTGMELINSIEFPAACATFVAVLSAYLPIDLVKSHLEKYMDQLMMQPLDKPKKRSIPLLNYLKIAYLNTKRKVCLPKLRNKSNPNYLAFKTFEKILRKES